VSLAGGRLRYEAEALPVVRARNCRALPQDMRRWGAGRWGGDAQVLCRSGKGAALELGLHVPSAGTYRVELHATRAPDYGRVQVSINGKRLGPAIDGYAKQVEPTGAIQLGPVRLEAGAQHVRFDVVGKNRASSNYLFGIDRLELVPQERGTGSSSRASSPGGGTRPLFVPGARHGGNRNA
jgi:hypothetical protein